MKIHFENHFSDRLMEISFESNATIAIDSLPRFLELQRRWSDNIMEWHTPYSCLVYIGGLTIAPSTQKEFARMLTMFRGFHMRKIVGIIGPERSEILETEKSAFLAVGFDALYSTRDEAIKALGHRGIHGASANDGSTRNNIHIENFFDAEYMEISFATPTVMADADDVQELRTRVEYAIHQWHSGYSIVVDCSKLSVASSTYCEFEKMEAFLRAFFCKGFFGYSPREGENYPFQIFLAKHLALENVAKGVNSGVRNTPNTSAKQPSTSPPAQPTNNL
jgi:hypothetical protein